MRNNHVWSLKGLSRLSHIMNYSDSIVQVCGILARYIRASCCKDKRTIYADMQKVPAKRPLTAEILLDCGREKAEILLNFWKTSEKIL